MLVHCAITPPHSGTGYVKSAYVHSKGTPKHVPSAASGQVVTDSCDALSNMVFVLCNSTSTLSNGTTAYSNHVYMYVPESQT